MASAPVVRPADPADARTLAELLVDFNEEFETPTPTADELERRLVDQLATGAVLGWIAEDDGEPVGFQLVTLRASPYYDHGIALLEELYVRPARRDRGIGTSLLAALLGWAETLGAGEIQINVDEVDVDTRRFYERHGFTNIEPSGGEESRMLLYLREL